MSHHKPCLSLFDEYALDYQRPSASKEWDEQITKPCIQRKIAHNKNTQVKYAYVESRIAHDYAKLFDIQLKHILYHMTEYDFAHSAGFAEFDKATENQLNLFRVENTLGYFLYKDITQHLERDSQIHAFRRWITISELLFKSHNYQGFFLIISQLSALNHDLKLDKELPICFKKLFNYFVDLISPSINFKALNNYVETHKRDNDFIPFVVISRQITALNTGVKSEDIGISTKSKKLQAALLEKIMTCRPKTLESLPNHLQATWNSISKEYNEIDPHSRRSPPVTPTNSPSNLYRRSLRPTFWPGNIDNYWKRLYDSKMPDLCKL